MNFPINIPSMIRFRRWNRKSYAMFCSVGKCVTIGALAKNVTEVSLAKQKNSLSLGGDCSTAFLSDDSSGDSEEDLSLIQENWVTSLFYSVVNVTIDNNGCNFIETIINGMERPDKYTLYLSGLFTSQNKTNDVRTN